MQKRLVWGNTIVKNEGRYLWFAIKSVIGFLDKLLIYDTGSVDTTVEVVKDLKKEYPQKIIFKQIGEVDAKGLTKARQDMLSQTNSDWVLILDGDEVWFEDSIKKLIETINEEGDKLYAIVVPTYNLVGDIYHYQEEKAGQYKILSRKGHLNLRAINRKTPGLHIKNDYPLEGFYNDKEKLLQNLEDKITILDTPILHFSHLLRSTTEQPLAKTLHRNKIKYELGERFPSYFKFPQVFYLKRPKLVPDPWVIRGKVYTLRSFMETPLKKLKRRLIN